MWTSKTISNPAGKTSIRVYPFGDKSGAFIESVGAEPCLAITDYLIRSKKYKIGKRGIKARADNAAYAYLDAK